MFVVQVCVDSNSKIVGGGGGSRQVHGLDSRVCLIALGEASSVRASHAGAVLHCYIYMLLLLFS